MTKTQAVLEFLQENALSLRTLPNLVDAQCQNGKLLLVFRNQVPELPQFTHKGISLTTVTQITDVKENSIEAPPTASKAQQILNKHNIKNLPQIQSISQSISPSGGKFNDVNAYANWKKRFNKE